MKISILLCLVFCAIALARPGKMTKDNRKTKGGSMDNRLGDGKAMEETDRPEGDAEEMRKRKEMTDDDRKAIGNWEKEDGEATRDNTEGTRTRKTMKDEDRKKVGGNEMEGKGKSGGDEEGTRKRKAGGNRKKFGGKEMRGKDEGSSEESESDSSSSDSTSDDSSDASKGDGKDMGKKLAGLRKKAGFGKKNFSIGRVFGYIKRKMEERKGRKGGEKDGESKSTDDGDKGGKSTDSWTGRPELTTSVTPNNSVYE